MKWIASGFIVASTVASGCAEPSRNLYEGIQMRNEIKKSPEERANSPHTPSYDQYRKERDKQERGNQEKATER
jgi:hypothetical protein